MEIVRPVVGGAAAAPAFLSPANTQVIVVEEPTDISLVTVSTRLVVEIVAAPTFSPVPVRAEVGAVFGSKLTPAMVMALIVPV